MLRRVITDKLTDYDALAQQAHLYFDAHIRHINIDSHGEFIRGHAKEGHDNDVDAFRHSYVSALYTVRYGESAADLAGQANELIGKNTPEAKNQDLWNNAHGRRYAEDFLDRDIEPSSQDLLQAVEKGLRNGELIIDPFTDLRRYDSSTEDDRYIRTRDRANHHSELHDSSSASALQGGTGTDPLTDSTAPDTQSLIRTTVEEFGMFTREQQQNFMMELNGWGIQFDSPTINAYLRDKLLAERFPELPEDGRAHIIDQVRQMEAEDGEKFSTRELTEYAQYELNPHLTQPSPHYISFAAHS